MIQRIQSLLFLGASVCFMILFYLDIVTFNGGEGQQAVLDLCYIKSTVSGKEDLSIKFVEIAPYAAIVLSIGLLGTIFLYKNRKLQIRVGNLMFLLNLCFLVFMLMAPDNLKEQLGEGNWEQQLGTGYYLPIFSIVMIILAVRAIKKDESLVKAADRLR